MYFRAFPIALSFRGILSGPVAVIRSQSRAVPCSLLHHLRDLRIGDFQAMLDGIAAAIQGALQTNSVVGVTGYLFPPAMRFVNNRFQLLHRQSGLRYQISVPIDPRTMGHIRSEERRVGKE